MWLKARDTHRSKIKGKRRPSSCGLGSPGKARRQLDLTAGPNSPNVKENSTSSENTIPEDPSSKRTFSNARALLGSPDVFPIAFVTACVSVHPETRAVMRSSEIDRRAFGDDSARINRHLAPIIMLFDLLQIAGLGHTGCLVQVAGVWP